jgi:bifunctional non-homologous end joining protein LigD
VAFDLDPGEGADILMCAEVALLVREGLDRLGLQSFPKVSGSKGIQVYLPLNVPVTYAATQPFARTFAQLLANQHSDRIVSDMAKVLRRGKVFIDWSQNADHKTTIGVYSLRAKREHPYVSMPVKWDELKLALKKGNAEPLYWQANDALARLDRVGDLFAPVLKLKQKLPDQFMALSATANTNTKAPKSLAEYQAKRNFARTTEPAAAVAPRRSTQGSRRRFVVQKHAASHLHYDFRLELSDTLKSWAVPKGVPLQDGQVATAFGTEDHPVDYLQFEGTIPKRQYGGGTVMVWDIGTFEIVEGNYWKGRLSVHLAGKKLKGEWTLEKKDDANGKPKWSLVKTNGDAKKIPARQGDVSALTNRTMKQIADDKSAVWQSDRALVTETAIQSSEPIRSSRSAQRVSAKVIAAPQFMRPMKATVVQQLPLGAEWIYEIKWDGYRALAAKHSDKVRLLSLKNKNLNSDFPVVVEAVRGIKAHTALLDGEVVAVNNRGKPSFQMLQNRKSLGRNWHIVYYAFDLLNLEGEDLTRVPLEQRKAKLKSIIGESGVRYSSDLVGDPEAIVAAVGKAGLEGIVAKQRQSVYRAGARVTSWLKLKLDPAQEFVIGGYNPNGAVFQSLLLGYYQHGKLVFAGKVRQGFDKSKRTLLMRVMQRLVHDRCPFANLPSSRKSHFGEGVTAEDMKKLVWLKPKLVAHCSFTEWTSYGLLRHATFLGLREDKDAKDVVRETFT